MTMRLLILIYSCSWLTLSAQENASVILVTNIKSTVRVDGIEHGTTEPGSGFRLLWYWKVNTILENQQKQIVLLAEIIDAIRRTQPTRVEPKASEKQTTG